MHQLKIFGNVTVPIFFSWTYPICSAERQKGEKLNFRPSLLNVLSLCAVEILARVLKTISCAPQINILDIHGLRRYHKMWARRTKSCIKTKPQMLAWSSELKRTDIRGFYCKTGSFFNEVSSVMWRKKSF